MTIYFVLPIYNEKENLQSLVADLRDLMKVAGLPYRIIAVNDGSTDGSLELLKEMQQVRDDLVITGSVLNMNVGAVFSAGIGEVVRHAADDDVMIIMESDQTSEIDLILPMAEHIVRDEADVVVASRYLPGGSYVNFPFLRKVFSHGANGLMRIVFPIKQVKDYTIFFRAYRVGLVRQAIKHFGTYGLIQTKGFVANAELLIKLSLFTSKVLEIPFVYNYGQKKGASKINVFRTINEYFVLIHYLRRILKKHKSLSERKTSS